MRAIQAEGSLGPQVEATGRPALDAPAPRGPVLQAMAPGDLPSTPSRADLEAAMARADEAFTQVEAVLTQTSQLLNTLRHERQVVQQARLQARETIQRMRHQRHDARALLRTPDGGAADRRRSAAPG